MKREIKTGDVVKHFKFETISKEEQAANKYLYVVRGFATHTETGERLVIYQALYAPFEYYARPIEMFTGEVNKERYPNIYQKYRFELMNEQKGMQNDAYEDIRIAVQSTT